MAGMEITLCQPRLLPDLVPDWWMLQAWSTGGLLSPTLPYQEPGAADGRAPYRNGVVSAPVPSWVHAAGGTVPDAGAHAGDEPSASCQTAGSATAAGAQQRDAVMTDRLFIVFRLCSGC